MAVGIAVVAIVIAQAPPGAVDADADPEEVRVHILQRSADGDDIIFRTDLTGENAVPVYQHAHIEDFRATASHLVISVRTEDDDAALIMTDLGGEIALELPLPGDGQVAQLQSADARELVGYTFSDAALDDSGGRESLLFTAALTDAAAEPTRGHGRRRRPARRGMAVRARHRQHPGAVVRRVAAAHRRGRRRDATWEAITIDGIARRSSDAVIERHGR